MRVKYKNELYQIIRENHIEPEDFELSEKKKDGLPAVILKHKKSPFKFIVRNSTSNYELFDFQYTEYGSDFALSPIFPNDEFTEFDIVANEFEEWLNTTLSEYLNDQNDIDLWSQLKYNTKSLDINSIDFDNKEEFLIEEKKQVKLAINELKLLINHRFNISESEREIVSDRLDYLINATERLNKYDWKSLVISTLISISVALSFDTEKGKLLFELFRKVFLQIQNIGQ
ncbi:hypothetical protein UMM65_16975 [Aureibaculum sp. 2210JD6-5]|uniref:hypothetical protein n=1 Tax=Aureibaculum sp. 2210JD6-5 TaxID=3103957 RepID=UPI002AAECEE7|nr:hypothetical protein [Aureibaculum sp. 2210JD6-5]MDY7396942.1 hypothetical protein [Aureibaculum sp. 2210JD6-5]